MNQAFQMLGAAQVAEILSCTPGTVEDMWRLKQLPGVKFGRSWVVTERALFEALDILCAQNFVLAADIQHVAVVPVPDRKAANSSRFRKEPPALPPLPQFAEAANSK